MNKLEEEKKYSNNDYDKLGDRIRKNVNNISEADYEMLQYLRTSYKTPLSKVFKSIEELSYKIDSHCVCTYRIKRIESIISKLIRFPDMRVNRAGDIAGCRCIFSSENDVYSFYNLIQKKQKQLPFEIKGKINDYIKEPKESGYRSIHLTVALKNDNRKIEIQIRSIEQHSWATLVEITDLLYGLKLKENGCSSNEELFKLHYLLSKSEEQLSMKEIDYISEIVIKHEYIQKLGSIFVKNCIDVRKRWNSLKLYNNHFFLISTGIDGVPDFEGFSSFNDAEKKYFDKFINNKSDKNIVLTHIRKNTSFVKISAAYSNYFLTYNNTLVMILEYLSKSVESSYNNNNILKFKKYYQAFLDIMIFWKENQKTEIISFNEDNNIKKSKAKYIEWGSTIIYGINTYNKLFKNTQAKLKFKVYNITIYAFMKYKYKCFIHSERKNN